MFNATKFEIFFACNLLDFIDKILSQSKMESESQYNYEVYL